MKELKQILFEKCREAAGKQLRFRTSTSNPNEPQTEEEARQYFRGIYHIILAAGLAEEYNEWKEKRSHVGEKIP